MRWRKSCHASLSAQNRQQTQLSPKRNISRDRWTKQIGLIFVFFFFQSTYCYIMVYLGWLLLLFMVARIWYLFPGKTVYLSQYLVYCRFSINICSVDEDKGKWARGLGGERDTIEIWDVKKPTTKTHQSFSKQALAWHEWDPHPSLATIQPKIKRNKNLQTK